jgi:peptidoglycan/xylan/chitin deacetylase (PgdA/CDA1 family)
MPFTLTSMTPERFPEAFRGVDRLFLATGNTIHMVHQVVTTDAFGKEAASVSSAPIHADESFWPDGARLAVSISMQFEAGAQPERGAESPFPPLDAKYPDLPALKDAFDVLYEEAATRRRLLSVSTHDRISGHPARVKALSEFIDYAQKHKGVWFARKDEIAHWTLGSANSNHAK